MLHNVIDLKGDVFVIASGLHYTNVVHDTDAKMAHYR